MTVRPTEMAELIAEGTEGVLPKEWTTDQLADFWHRMTEQCALRLIRLKPEIVTRADKPRKI